MSELGVIQKSKYKKPPWPGVYEDQFTLVVQFSFYS